MDWRRHSSGGVVPAVLHPGRNCRLAAALANMPAGAPLALPRRTPQCDGSAGRSGAGTSVSDEEAWRWRTPAASAASACARSSQVAAAFNKSRRRGTCMKMNRWWVVIMGGVAAFPAFAEPYLKAAAGVNQSRVEDLTFINPVGATVTSNPVDGDKILLSNVKNYPPGVSGGLAWDIASRNCRFVPNCDSTRGIRCRHPVMPPSLALMSTSVCG